MAYNQNDAVKLGHLLEVAERAADYTAEVAQAAAAAIAALDGGAKLTTITLGASWTGSGPYTQTVSVTGGTANSAVDLRPDAAAITRLLDDGVEALYIENTNGTFTAYAVGAAPSAAMTIQATVTEVST